MFNSLISSYIDVVVPTPTGVVNILTNDVKLSLQKPKDIDVEYDDILKRVNEAKDQLEPLYKIAPPNARNIMRDIDLYTETKYDLKTKYNFEVSTNASLKMLEMIVHNDLIGKILKRKDKFLAFHNAELPGAFIATFKKYVEYKYPENPSVYDFRASSYFPESTTSNVLEDGYLIYENNREKWLMGPKPNGLLKDEEITGDVTDVKVLRKIAETIQSLGGADIYTSDIGIDLSSNFNLEEDMTSILNYGQIVCGLMVLADYGSLVVKTYTFTKEFSRSLICLLSSLFDKVHITKPATSRPANSEIYLVAEGFKKSLFSGCAFFSQPESCDPFSPSILPKSLIPINEIQEELLNLLEFYVKKNALCQYPTNFGPIVKIDEKVDKIMLLAANLIHSEQQIRVLTAAKDLFYSYSKKYIKALCRDIANLKKKKSEEYVSINLK